jgi:hypothetical protein
VVNVSARKSSFDAAPGTAAGASLRRSAAETAARRGRIRVRGFRKRRLVRTRTVATFATASASSGHDRRDSRRSTAVWVAIAPIDSPPCASARRAEDPP